MAECMEIERKYIEFRGGWFPRESFLEASLKVL